MMLIVAVFLPLFAALLCWLKPLRSCVGHNRPLLSFSFVAVVTGTGSFEWSRRCNSGLDRSGRLGIFVLLLVTFVCTLAAVFAGGYMRHGNQHANGCGGFTATPTCWFSL